MDIIAVGHTMPLSRNLYNDALLPLRCFVEGSAGETNIKMRSRILLGVKGIVARQKMLYALITVYKLKLHVIFIGFHHPARMSVLINYR